MASRTSTSVTVGIALTIFILLSVALFVTTMVFFSQKQRAEQDLRQIESENAAYVSGADKGAQRVRIALDEARRERKSLVSHLLERSRLTMQTAVGNADLTPEQMTEQINRATDLGGGSLLDRIERLETQLASARRDVRDARAEASQAIADAEAEIEVSRVSQAKVDQVVEDASRRIDGYGNEVTQLRNRIDGFVSDVERDRDTERADFQTEIGDLETQVAELRDALLVCQDRARQIGDSGATLSPLDEFALVDGEVVAIDPLDGTAVISLGMSDKVAIGLTFSVYSDAGELRTDPTTGGYMPGKAVLEVIRVEADNARCRVVRESRGNPVVAGDIIANPVYDPNKAYRFVVFGAFDTNRDGIATSLEASRLKGLIEEWGGTVVDDIQGDLDFLILGARPTMPPAPGGDAHQARVDEFVRLSRVVDRYDELFERASEASIPVLNENRLYTLIGIVPN